jgi:hypothetical protein
VSSSGGQGKSAKRRPATAPRDKHACVEGEQGRVSRKGRIEVSDIMWYGLLEFVPYCEDFVLYSWEDGKLLGVSHRGVAWYLSYSKP